MGHAGEVGPTQPPSQGSAAPSLLQPWAKRGICSTGGGGASAWVPEGIVVGSQLGRERGTRGSCQRGRQGAGEEREHGLWALTPARSAGTTAAARDGLKGPSLEGGLPRAPAADPELQVPCAPSPGGAAAGCPHRQAPRCPRLRWSCCGDCMGLA